MVIPQNRPLHNLHHQEGKLVELPFSVFDMPRIGNITVTQNKREYVVAAVVTGLVLSSLSMVLRIWARAVIIGRLRKEDWVMVVGLFLSYGTIGILLYGLSVGLAEPFSALGTRNQRQVLLVGSIIISFFFPFSLPLENFQSKMAN